MNEPMEQAIETVGLRRVFGEVAAVESLDLTVEPGTFFGFLGPNGAGKSTTIKMLTGLLAPSAGTARILGHDVVTESVEAKRLIGVVPEESALFERLTGLEYLRFVGRMYAMPRTVIDERSQELLELMALHDDAGKLIVDYSHGMRKKLSICAAVIHEPRVLFLDEPFEGIDAISSTPFPRSSCGPSSNSWWRPESRSFSPPTSSRSWRNCAPAPTWPSSTRVGW